MAYQNTASINQMPFKLPRKVDFNPFLDFMPFEAVRTTLEPSGFSLDGRRIGFWLASLNTAKVTCRLLIGPSLIADKTFFFFFFWTEVQ